MKRVLFMLLLATSLLSDSLKESAWLEYKKSFLQDGRVKDPQNANVTHTEGIGYGLYFSYKMGDTESFEKIFRWYKSNIKKNSSNLPGWKWGENSQTHRWEMLDTTSASDANLWISYALALMYEKTGNNEYKKESKELLLHIKEHQILYNNKRAYLLSWEKNLAGEKQWILNPSYMIFEIFEYFYAQTDETIWLNLIQSSREMLKEARFSSLELNPDWLIYDLASKRFSLREKHKKFSYDAIRIPLNILRSNLNIETKKELLEPYRKYTLMMRDRALGVVELQKGVISLYNFSYGHLSVYLEIAKFYSDETKLFKNLLEDRMRQNHENYYAYSLYLFTLL